MTNYSSIWPNITIREIRGFLPLTFISTLYKLKLKCFFYFHLLIKNNKNEKTLFGRDDGRPDYYIL